MVWMSWHKTGSIYKHKYKTESIYKHKYKIMPHWFWILGTSQWHAIGIKICQGLCSHRTLVSVFCFAKLQCLLYNSLFYQITMKVTTKCQIGFWGHFLRIRWHCNRASHHCREVQYLYSQHNLSQYTVDSLFYVINSAIQRFSIKSREHKIANAEFFL